jgi:hypothetical protein
MWVFESLKTNEMWLIGRKQSDKGRNVLKGKVVKVVILTWE